MPPYSHYRTFRDCAIRAAISSISHFDTLQLKRNSKYQMMCEEDRRDTFCLHGKIDVYWFAIVFSISTIKIKTLIVDISYVWITIPFSIKSGWAIGTTVWFFASMNQEVSPNMSLATHDQRAKWASKLALGNFDWLRLQHTKKGHGLTRLQIVKKTGKNWFIFSKRLHLFHEQRSVVEAQL